MDNILVTLKHPPGKPNHRILWASLAAVIAIWVLARWFFFFGFLGYDDLWYYTYAAKWGALPQNHWEVRVLFTGLIRLCTDLFGHSEFTATLPALTSSFVMLLITFRLGWKFFGVSGAFLSGLLFAALPMDVFSSTSVDAVALSSAFSSLGLLVLVERKRMAAILSAGILFGMAIFSHVFALYALAAAAFAWFVHTAPKWKWKESILLFGTGLGTFLLVNSVVFQIMAGSILFPFQVSSKSHLETFGGIVYDFAWAIWPIKAIIFNNNFGFLLLAAAWAFAWKWKKGEPVFRFLAIFSAVFYVYTNWGTQSPLEYLPLWHLPRYWYPLDVPVCLAVGCGLASLPRKVGWTGAIALAGIQVALLLASGTWGENVEVSKALLRYAEENPNQRFATDCLTLNEMYALNGCRPPRNVFPIRGVAQPAYYSVPADSQVDSQSRPLRVLLNLSQVGRNGFSPFLKLASQGKLVNIGPARYRTLSAFLPETLGKRSFMLRHPPPAVVTFP